MDLGATEWTTFRKITLPMISPGVAAAAMLAAAISFDDYVITSFNAGQTQTFPLFIFGATRQGVPAEVNVLATMLLIAVLVLMGLNVLVQKRLARRDAHPHRAIEPLTPRSRISLRGPSEGRTEHARDRRTGGRRGWSRRRRRVASGDHDGPRPLRPDARWTTVFKPPAGVGIEGLTADKRGELYAPGRVAGAPCPVLQGPRTSAWSATCPRRATRPGWRSGRTGGCTSPTAARSWSCGRTPRRRRRPRSTPTGVPGSNGVAWDRARRPVGLRRRHRPGPRVADRPRPRAGGGRSACSRWPTTRSRAASAVTCAGCRPGRSRSRETGRAASNTLGSQHWWPTGSRSDDDGTLFVADTARGAIWRVFLDRRGRILSRTGCDTTFTANTLCLDNVLVQHPYLDGADGIVLDDDEQHLRLRQRAQRDRGRDRRRAARSSSSATRPAPTGCATRARSSSRPARCWWAASCARRTQTARGVTTSRRPPGEGPKINCVFLSPVSMSKSWRRAGSTVSSTGRRPPPARAPR